MMSHHLSDEELQMVASDKQVADAATTLHIKNCTLCQEQLAVYKLILSGINEQPEPAFNFDLTEAVLQQLQSTPAKKTFSVWPFTIAPFIAIPLYLFRKNFLLLTAGLSALFLLLSMITCIIIIGFHIFKLYQNYQRQLDQLNISE